MTKKSPPPDLLNTILEGLDILGLREVRRVLEEAVASPDGTVQGLDGNGDYVDAIDPDTDLIIGDYYAGGIRYLPNDGSGAFGEGRVIAEVPHYAIGEHNVESVLMSTG